LIEDSRFENNLLAFRTAGDNQFFWVSNVAHNPIPIKFDTIPRLEKRQIDDYLVVPKNQSKSKNVELYITDPDEGIHLVIENKNNSIYLKDLGEFSMDAAAKPLGKISCLAMNAKKDILSLYADSGRNGTIIILKSDLEKELNRLDTHQIDAT